MPNEFKVPHGGEAFTGSVIDKTRLLISQGIWEGIEELNFDRWLRNFKTPEEKYFAACLLNAFTFRSRKMCHSMMRNILMDVTPNHCRKLGINNFSSIEEWSESLADGNQLVRFVPVNISDGRVKSSSVVVREFIEANDIQQRFIQQPENISRAIKSGAQLIVFLDDIAGSGYQFLKFCKQQSLFELQDQVSFIYIPLAGHVDAIKRIESTLPFISVKPIDLITNEDNFFHPCPDGFFRGDQTNKIQDAKVFYDSIFMPNDRALKYRYGMNNQSLTYSFFFSTPNNNLKAIYHEEDGEWRRLVFRGRS